VSGSTDIELIRAAASVIRTREHGGYVSGDVGCALLSETGEIYLGVCIDTPSSMGFCAEHNAIGTMVTAGESRIQRVVAVWRNNGDAYVVAPCGRCREFMARIDERNLEAEVILSETLSLPLKDLLPHYAAYNKLSAGMIK
jgi:cytidine deaminase